MISPTQLENSKPKECWKWLQLLRHMLLPALESDFQKWSYCEQTQRLQETSSSLTTFHVIVAISLIPILNNRRTNTHTPKPKPISMKNNNNRQIKPSQWGHNVQCNAPVTWYHFKFEGERREINGPPEKFPTLYAALFSLSLSSPFHAT